MEGEQRTDEIRSEESALHTEFRDLETRHRSAIIAEGEEEQRAAGQFAGEGDGEPAEVRSLLGRVHLADYLTPAASGLGLAGPAAELNAALECPLVGTGRRRGDPLANPGWPGCCAASGPRAWSAGAFTDTGDYAGGVAARPILQRLFGMDIMAALGVRMDSVPAGRTEWPLITGGAAPDMKAEGAAVAATFATETLKAKRLTGKYEYTHEQAAQVPDLEQALRRDLADAVKAKMSSLILLGNEGTNAHEPDRFLTKIAAPADPGATSTFADYAGTPALAVDGIHASEEGQSALVMGTASYQHAASTYRTNAGFESAVESLKRRAGMVMASNFVPAPAGNTKIQNGTILHAMGPNGGGADMRGDSVAAIWPTLEVIRDIYTQASQAVVLTWITLWDAETAFRAAAYKRVAFRLA